MHQGWPKFAASQWRRHADGGLVALTYAPSSVSTRVKGVGVHADVCTDYPFADTVAITVAAERAQTFALHLRIPGWASGAEVSAPGSPASAAEPGTLFKLERRWGGNATVRVRLPRSIGVQRRYQAAVAVDYGPLVLSLRVGEEWKHLRGQEPHADWEVYPTTAWNYAIRLDPAEPAK